MSRIADYRRTLHEMPADRWDAYLASNSHLPGPRGNIELALAVAEEAPPEVLRRYAASEDEFEAVCGAVGLGRLLADGDEYVAADLRELAADR
ncbi:MAG: HEAT repeat domain-containing protein, partial [Actinobacteria bacterium]